MLKEVRDNIIFEKELELDDNYASITVLFKDTPGYVFNGQIRVDDDGNFVSMFDFWWSQPNFEHEIPDEHVPEKLWDLTTDSLIKELFLE